MEKRGVTLGDDTENGNEANGVNDGVGVAAHLQKANSGPRRKMMTLELGDVHV